ncbi:hypothetical protein WJX72_010802 [[Myrmecia] bisecta]|uniref:Uncharacterized protein n=1 Tax=[Myrmecia] bisecta TaxID=41462 RepID=A0AAW1P7G4_9CHLO
MLLPAHSTHNATDLGLASSPVLSTIASTVGVALGALFITRELKLEQDRVERANKPECGVCEGTGLVDCLCLGAPVTARITVDRSTGGPFSRRSSLLLSYQHLTVYPKVASRPSAKMLRQGAVQLIRGLRITSSSGSVIRLSPASSLFEASGLQGGAAARFSSALIETIGFQQETQSCTVPGCSGACSHGRLLRRMTGQQRRPMSAQASETPRDAEHVHLGNEVDKELLRAAESGVDQLFYQVESHGDTFTELNVATTYEQLAKLAEGMSEEEKKQKIHDNKSFQTLVDMTIAGSSRFHSKQLTNIVKSLSSLDFDEDMLLDRISQTLLKRLSSATPDEVVALATGLADIGSSPSVVLFDALQKRAIELKDKVSQDQKTALEQAYDKLGYGHEGISEKIK